jgi:hypothetical protein
VIDEIKRVSFTVDVQIVRALRTRFVEYREGAAPLSTWRAFQLEILDAARRSPIASRDSIWTILGDGFWFEGDPDRVASLIDAAITELERHYVAAGTTGVRG